MIIRKYPVKITCLNGTQHAISRDLNLDIQTKDNDIKELIVAKISQICHEMKCKGNQLPTASTSEEAKTNSDNSTIINIIVALAEKEDE